jgi:hypothetical protein
MYYVGQVKATPLDGMVSLALFAPKMNFSNFSMQRSAKWSIRGEPVA